MSLLLRIAALDPVRMIGAEPPRSPKWPAVERAHLAKEGWCRYCGGTTHLQVHHIKPYHLFPDEELNDGLPPYSPPGNLITLCMDPERECHLRHGHLGAWFRYNPHIREQAKVFAPVQHMMLSTAPPWAFTAVRDGDDLVVVNGRGTCWGGDADPQDDGSTASGWSTKTHRDTAAVSLPMRGQMFAGLSPAEHAALDDSPIPKIPWLNIVEVAVLPASLQQLSWADIKAAFNDGHVQWQPFPVIDLGPGHRTGNAIDLTVAAARRFDANASAVNFAMQCAYRVRGGALFLPS